MSSPVEEIKSRLSIEQVIGSYIKLEKAGTSYKGLCPFHNEKSPSFNVSPTRQAYYCFGCNRGGDMFTFVEEIEGVSFVDALKMLAERAGVRLEREEFKKNSERDRLYDLMDDVATFYERTLGEHEGPLEYLRERGVSDETIKNFRIGYVPPTEVAGWRSAHTYLKGKGYSDEEIEKVGLTKKTEKGYYDRFRSRIMFPIRDQSGRVVAFTGRIFQSGSEKSEEAKYVNSPETILYDKSTILFAYDLAKSAIRKQNFTVVVEGQMDCIMSHQAGTENTVAVSGTALTEKHLGLLKRLSDNIVFAFDADDAGVNATSRAFRIALTLGMNVRVVSIPDAKDPADLILRDPVEWETALQNSLHIIDFLLMTLKERHIDAREYRKSVEDTILPLLLSIPSRIEQAHFIVEIARRLGVKEEAVWEEVKRKQSAESFVSRTVEPSQSGAEPPRIRTPRDLAEEALIGLLLWQESAEEKYVATEVVRTKYQEIFVAYALTPREVGKEESEMLAAKAEHMYENTKRLKDDADELLHKLEKEVLKERQAALLVKMSDASARGDKEEEKILLAQYQALTPRLIELEQLGRRES